MTWLFTQVWLWSLAAFVLGALLSWLLFVPRLRRRIRWLRQDLADWEAAYDEAYHASPPGPSGLDLLPGQEEIDGWERERDWDRTRISGDTARFGPVSGTEPEGEAVEQQPAPVQQDDSDLRLEEQREARTARIEPVRASAAPSAAPEPTAPAEGGIPGAESEPVENSWFRNPELERPGAPENGAVGDLDGDEAQLPKREPGVGPRPGPSEVSGVRIPGEPRKSGGVGQGSAGAGSAASVESAAGEDSPADEAADEDGPAGEKVLGKDLPHGGGMVKGHFASRQYHTPDSPQYGEIEADVWFRTAADAEQAGFASWDADRS